MLGGLLLLTFLTFLQPALYRMGVGGTVGIQLLSETSYLKGYVSMALLILAVFFIIVGIDVAHS